MKAEDYVSVDKNQAVAKGEKTASCPDAIRYEDIGKLSVGGTSIDL